MAASAAASFRLRIFEPPANAGPISVAMKADQRFFLVSVQPVDRIVQADLAIDPGHDGNWVVDTFGPVAFLEGGQHEFLIGGGHTKAFNESSVYSQLPANLFPLWRCLMMLPIFE